LWRRPACIETESVSVDVSGAAGKGGGAFFRADHLEANAEYLRGLAPRLNTINVGPKVDIAATQRLLGGAIGVAGNIDHIDLLPLRSPREVEAAVHAAIAAAGGDPRFMVAPGCEITSDTPPENVEAFVRAAATYVARMA
jgi:uroporphyrinogen-III decarboxylase